MTGVSRLPTSNSCAGGDSRFLDLIAASFSALDIKHMPVHLRVHQLVQTVHQLADGLDLRQHIADVDYVAGDPVVGDGGIEGLVTVQIGNAGMGAVERLMEFKKGQIV